MRGKGSIPWWCGFYLVLAMALVAAGMAHAESDVTGKVQLVKGVLSYDRLNKQSYLDVLLLNTSQETLLMPIKVVVSSLSTPYVTVASADGLENGKAYFLYSNEVGSLMPGQATATKRWLFSNPKTLKFTYTNMVLGTVSTPEATIEKAVTAATTNDASAFTANVPIAEQESMQKKIGQLGTTAPEVLERLSGIINGATVVEETATCRKMRGFIELPDGTNQEVLFDMILENGIWKLRGL